MCCLWGFGFCGFVVVWFAFELLFCLFGSAFGLVGYFVRCLFIFDIDWFGFVFGVFD